MKHTGPISCVAARGNRVATGGYDNRVVLWDAETRKTLALGHHDHLVNHCEFSSDGKWLATASSDYSARLWEIPTLRLQTVFTGHGDDVDMVVFSPDNALLATCALDRAVRIFDLTGHCLKTFWGHTGNIISLLWAEAGRKLVSCGVDGTVREWDAIAGGEICCHSMDGVRTDTLAIDSRGRIFTGDDRGRISLIEKDRTRVFQAHAAGIKKIVYDAEADLLASFSYDKTLALWRIGETGEIAEWRRAKIPPPIWARAAAALGKNRLVMGTFGATYAIYDFEKQVWDLEGVEAGDAINAIAFDQGKVYTVGDAGRVRENGKPLAELGSLCNFLVPAQDRLYAGGQLGQVFDVRQGQVAYTHPSPLNCGATFTRKGKPHLAVGTYTGEILIFVLEENHGLKRVKTLQVFENAVKGISVQDGRLFSVCASTDIAWHDCEDFGLVQKVARAHEKIANACCPVGSNGFATVARDRSLRLWTDDGNAVYPSPHLNSVKCVCVSADGQSLMTGSYGGTLAKFDLTRRVWTSWERPTTAGISSLAYDTERQRFLAASYDGNVYVTA